jgi:hypothetical protein
MCLGMCCVATTAARTTENTVTSSSSGVVVQLLLVTNLLPSNVCCLVVSRSLPRNGSIRHSIYNNKLLQLSTEHLGGVKKSSS